MGVHLGGVNGYEDRRQGFPQLRYLHLEDLSSGDGGHAASEGEIRAIYTAALANVADAARVFDRCRILDSSEPWKRPRLIARATGGKVALELGAPSWAAVALRSDFERS